MPEDQEPERVSIGRERAIALAESNWWVGREPRDVVAFQLFARELCMPFDQFHEAVEKALGRPVWTHEFAFMTGLQREFLGERPAPSMEDILDLIPEDKRIVVAT